MGKGTNEKSGKKSFFKKWFDKLDKKMQDQANSRPCCCRAKENKDTCSNKQ